MKLFNGKVYHKEFDVHPLMFCLKLSIGTSDICHGCRETINTLLKKKWLERNPKVAHKSVTFHKNSLIFL